MQNNIIKNEEDDKTKDGIKETAGSDKDQMIGLKELLWYCKQHPKVQNTHRDEKNHIQYSKDHVGDQKTKVDDVVFTFHHSHGIFHSI